MSVSRRSLLLDALSAIYDVSVSRRIEPLNKSVEYVRALNVLSACNLIRLSNKTS